MTGRRIVLVLRHSKGQKQGLWVSRSSREMGRVNSHPGLPGFGAESPAQPTPAPGSLSLGRLRCVCPRSPLRQHSLPPLSDLNYCAVGHELNVNESTIHIKQGVFKHKYHKTR